MKDKLLRAKAWKYFIIVFCIPQVASQFLINNYMTSLAESIGESSIDFNPDALMLRFSVLLLVSFLCAIPFYLWMWAVNNELPKYIPEDLRVNPSLFNFSMVSSFLISGVSSLLLLLSIKRVMGKFIEIIGPDFDPDLIDPSEMLGMLGEFKLPFILMMIGFVLSLFCYYFTAKTISKATLQRKPGFFDNFVNFLLHFVFFGSVWYFQPLIKKAMDKGPFDEFGNNNITDIDDLL